jgi:hypothetical protein
MLHEVGCVVRKLDLDRCGADLTTPAGEHFAPPQGGYRNGAL